MPASRGQFILYKYHPLYNRVVGGVNSDVVGVGGHKRRLVLVTKGELNSVTKGGTLVCRLTRLNLIESLVGRLVGRELVSRELVVIGLVVRELVVGGLLFARGLVIESFVNRSFVVKRSRSLWKDLYL
jgi:hypothetical protein